MDAKKKILLLALIVLFVGIGGIAFLAVTDVAVLNPQGWIAQKERDLLLFATYLMLLIVVPVIILTFVIAWKYRADNHRANYHPNWDYSLLAESLWWGIPFVMMAILGVVTWKSCHELDPFKPISSTQKPLTIQAVALQWKWLFLYPEQQIATVNFVQFPEKTPIHFEITADAPMNSFWIPRLGGQVYAMAGMRSELHLIVNETGSFPGSSANISGDGFSGMTFVAKASTEEEFEEWVASTQKASSLDYEALALPSQYNPQAFYRLDNPHLFNEIMMSYMPEHAHE